jgi:hypothetical protein
MTFYFDVELLDEALTSYGMWNCLTRLHCRNIRTVARHVSSSVKSKSMNLKLQHHKSDKTVYLTMLSTEKVIYTAPNDRMVLVNTELERM